MRSPSFYVPAPDLSTADDALRAYQGYLLARNGADFGVRERRMKAFDPTLVRARTPIDSTRFNQNYARFSGDAMSLDELALLSFVKMNAAEAYGVEVITATRQELRAGRVPGLVAEVEQTVAEEERYHTQLLVGAAGHFDGLRVGSAWRPQLPLRLLIGALARLPKRLFHPVLLGAEIAGVYTFNWMLRRLDDLFVGQPEVRESMQRRLTEVLIDEIGHISFNRILVGALGRAVARPLAKLVTLQHHVTGRELVALGMGANALGGIDRFDYLDLPEEVRRRAFFI